ncbi:hypothetical protein ACWGJW_34980 [Streptomyces nigrescens]
MGGLYLDPLEKALVLFSEEKSQIRALDRSQLVLSMLPGFPERRSQGYVLALLTTLEVATGKVIGPLHRRHRAVELKKSLARLDDEFPGLEAHLILDN